MSNSVEVRALERIGAAEIRGLADVLIDCVDGGASVSFMHPMTRAKADAFWISAAASAARDERVIFAAYDTDSTIIGTVQAIWAQAENQPHRGDIAKMLVHRRGRRRGIGALLLKAAEDRSLSEGKTLLVLDTASDDAERLYERSGWSRCGVIPDYALMPDGAMCKTVVFYKSLQRISRTAE
jgi:GNAT superfamily N-acetyltransferase